MITIKQIIQALKDSLKHWEHNVIKAKKGKLCWDDIKSGACACCRVFFYQSKTHRLCSGCPLSTEKNTPYYRCCNGKWQALNQGLLHHENPKSIYYKTLAIKNHIARKLRAYEKKLK